MDDRIRTCRQVLDRFWTVLLEALKHRKTIRIPSIDGIKGITAIDLEDTESIAIIQPVIV